MTELQSFPYFIAARSNSKVAPKKIQTIEGHEKFLHELAKDIQEIKEAAPKEMKVPLNHLLRRITDSLGYSSHKSPFLDRGEYAHVTQRVREIGLHPTTYDHNYHNEGVGITLQEVAILSSFLTFFTSESSEAQKLPSL